MTEIYNFTTYGEPSLTGGGWSLAIFDHEVYKNTHIVQEKEDYE